MERNEFLVDNWFNLDQTKYKRINIAAFSYTIISGVTLKVTFSF